MIPRGFAKAVKGDAAHRFYSGHGGFDNAPCLYPADTLTETLPNGLQNIYTYDVLNRIKTSSFKADSASAVNPDGGYSINEYAANGTLAVATDPRGNKTYYKYDGLNRETGRWSPANGSSFMYLGKEYDKAGNITKETRCKDNVSALSVPASNLIWNAYSFDALNRVNEQTDSMGGKVTYSYVDSTDTVTQKAYRSVSEYDQTISKYNHFGQVKQSALTVDAADFTTGATELVTTVTFDQEGNVLTQTRPNSLVTTYTYDLLGRMLTASEPGFDETGAAGTITTTYTYDFRGNKLTEKDPLNRTTAYEYDKRGFLTKVTDAKGGISIYSYDLGGRLTAEVTPKNYVAGAAVDTLSRRSFEYDKMGRTLKSKDIYKDSTGSFKTIVNSNTYDVSGNRLTASDGLGYVTSYTYDAANRQISVLDPESASKGLAFTRQTAYNGLGQIASEKDARNVITSYTYNGQGRLLSTATGSVTTKSAAYDLAGNMLTESDGNGNTASYVYNNIGKVRTVTLPGDATIASYTVSYKYDNAGNVSRSESSLGKVNTFTYDKQGKQLSATEANTSGAGAITNSARYDLAGNIRFTVDGNNVTTEYTYNALNQKLTQKAVVTINGARRRK